MGAYYQTLPALSLTLNMCTKPHAMNYCLKCNLSHAEPDPFCCMLRCCLTSKYYVFSLFYKADMVWVVTMPFYSLINHLFHQSKQ